MKQISSDAEMALRSLYRVTAKVFQGAIRDNKPIPVWEDGKIIYHLPAESEAEELLSRSKAVVAQT